MRKVLFVVDEKKVGGVSTVLENILNNIDYTNIDVDVLILHNNGTAFTNLNDKKAINIITNTAGPIKTNCRLIKWYGS